MDCVKLLNLVRFIDDFEGTAGPNCRFIGYRTLVVVARRISRLNGVHQVSRFPIYVADVDLGEGSALDWFHHFGLSDDPSAVP